MFNSVIQSDIPLGTLAAILTALEYVLSILSGLSVRAAVHGFWLWSLHRNAKGHISIARREQKSFIKDVMASLIGIWLVVGVALVESNLQNGIRVEKIPTNSPLCVSMFGRYNPNRLSMHRPTYGAAVESWIMRVAEQIDCGERGISTVGVGGITDSKGVTQNMSAPICAQSEVDVTSIKTLIGNMRFRNNKLEPKFNQSGGYIIFPLDGRNLGRKLSGHRTTKASHGPCEERGISLYATSMHTSFSTLGVGFENMTGTVHEKFCKLHGARPVVPVPLESVSTCFQTSKSKLDQLPGDCLRRNAPRKYQHQVEVRNVSVLVLGRNISSASYACPFGTAKLEYVFLEGGILPKTTAKNVGNDPFLVPLSLSMVDGYCERTVAALAQSALFYSANQEWDSSDLSQLPRRTRYYAYMMAVSAAQFPLHTVGGEETARAENGKCFLRPVVRVTEIPIDWRFGVLISGITVVILVVTIGTGFRLLFNGEVWDVGSAKWSLRKLLGGGLNDSEKEQEVVIEILPRNSKEIEEVELVSKSETTGRNIIGRLSRKLGENTLEYRLRTVRASTDENTDTQCNREDSHATHKR